MKGNVLNFTASNAVPAFRFVALGATEGTVALASADGDAVGVSYELDAAQDGRQDVQLDGIAEVECGGSVTFGAKIASDADGKAIAAESGEYLGIALEGGVSGDIIRVKLSGGYVAATAQAETSESNASDGETTGQG